MGMFLLSRRRSLSFPSSDDGTLRRSSRIHSKEMARNCSTSVSDQGVLPGFIDLGVAGEDAHTAFSSNPNVTAVNAFIDYLYLMDADIIVRSGSSFSGTVADIKGLKCREALSAKDVPVSGLFVCLPAIC